MSMEMVEWERGRRRASVSQNSGTPLVQTIESYVGALVDSF
jgi:hypothetical protein